jgi:hypothetical protein
MNDLPRIMRSPVCWIDPRFSLTDVSGVSVIVVAHLNARISGGEVAEGELHRRVSFVVFPEMQIDVVLGGGSLDQAASAI